MNIDNKSDRKILITSALPYVNNHPHLGNLIGSVLSADCFARYCRLKGTKTLFIGGTDEFGTPTEVQAIKEGITPMEVCNKYHAIHKEVYEWFNCSFDIFGRTTNSEHKGISQDIFTSLYQNNLILPKTVTQLYCENCDRFLADRYIEGTCHHCFKEGARGDQCDSCSNLIDTLKLKDPKCKLCGLKPIVRDSNHLFLDLKNSVPELKKWHSSVIHNWTKDAMNTTNAWIKKGLDSRCISRDLKWGIPIPLEGYENKVFYVWFDAPIGYISITASLFKSSEKQDQKIQIDTPIIYNSDEAIKKRIRVIPFKLEECERRKQPYKQVWCELNQNEEDFDDYYWNEFEHPVTGSYLPSIESKLPKLELHVPLSFKYNKNNTIFEENETWQDWWCNPEVDLYEFMGKDNIPFHSIIFPATLLGTLNKYKYWTLPKALYTTDYLNYEDGKFSKSRNVGVFCTDAMNSGLPSFVWRYYLFAIRPENGDTSFRWDEFVNRNNGELLGKFGNYCNRVLKLCSKFFDGIIPEYELTNADHEFINKINKHIDNYCKLMDKGCFRDALRIVIDISAEGNVEFNRIQPWKIMKKLDNKEDKLRANTSIVLGCNLIYLLSKLAYPFIPTLSDQLLKQLNLNDIDIDMCNFIYNIKLNTGDRISKNIKPLVPTITEDQKLEFINKFSNSNK